MTDKDKKNLQNFLENIEVEVSYIYNSIRTFFNDVKCGISNLLYYLPTIWNDRYWDYEFILTLLNKKLIQMRDNIKKNNILADTDKICKEIDDVLYQIICYKEADERFEMSNQDLLYKIKNEKNGDELLYQFCFNRQENEEKQWNKIWELIRDNGRNWWE